MPGHDIVVIGASSGGVEVLSRLVAGLPETFPAAVFIVLHVRPDAPSLLPAILNRAGCLPAAHAVDSEPIRTGRIYVAPPGMQMYLHNRRVSVERGPRENTHRPAIDPLFRTAAHYHGPRVVGVILSGALDDGTAGLYAVKQAGGIAVVQDPADASCSSMPTHALARVTVDHVAKSADLAALLAQLVDEPAPEGNARNRVPLETTNEADGPFEPVSTGERIGTESGLTCPDCHGVLRVVEQGDVLRFRCRVGHAYTSQTMLEHQGDSVENALWIAVRSLEERVVLLEKLSDNARRRGHDGVAAMFGDRVEAVNRDVQTLREVISTGRTLEPTVQERIS
jgi:two-component system chemotaxis response regulator CheB